MTIFAQLSDRAYNVRAAPYTLNGNIPAGKVVQIKVTLTRDSWPDIGEAIMTVSLIAPDGVASSFDIMGGDLLFRGNLVPASSMTWNAANSSAGQGTLASGQYTLSVQLNFAALQAASVAQISTALTVEWF